MTNRRRDEIENYIRIHKSATVSELCDIFHVSDMTIRRDLIQLENENKVVRFHGGATSFKDSNEGQLDIRAGLSCDEKEEIAILAREYLSAYFKEEHPRIIFLGSGSTVHKSSELLTLPEDVIALTDNLPVATQLSKNPDNSVIMLGGQILPPSYNVVGYTAEEMIKSFSIDCAIIGTGAIDENGVLYMHNMLECSSMRSILERAKRIILLADHTKFGKTNAISLIQADEKFTIISDSGMSEKTIANLEKNHITVIRP